MENRKTYQNGAELFVYTNGALIIEDQNGKVLKQISQTDMQEISNSYKGVNRIFKPMGLLFWSDCNNGKFNNWK